MVMKGSSFFKTQLSKTKVNSETKLAITSPETEPKDSSTTVLEAPKALNVFVFN